MTALHIDYETRSTVDLKHRGVYVYAESPDTDIWCMAYAFDEDEPLIWRPGTPVPDRIVRHIAEGGIVYAHNAAFERIMTEKVAGPRYGFPVPKPEQWICTAAMAAAMSLPRHLDGLARALNLAQKKDDEGYRLMLRMCRPRKIHDDGRIEWWDVPERRDRLEAYCKQDVRTERDAECFLRGLGAHEQEIYRLDQRINDRGIQLDRRLIAAAELIVDQALTRANARLDDLTNGSVSKVSQTGQMREWLNAVGMEADSVSKAAVAALLERDDLAENVEEVLELRAEAGRSSVAKLKSMRGVACADGRARGLLLYHGASTGRWTGRLLQPHNFPRGEIADVESYIDAVLAGDYEMIDMLAPPVIVVLSMLRAMMTAGEGNDLLAGDFAAVEARVLNWLAGQDDISDLFRAMDAGDKSKHPYKVMAVRMGRGATTADIVKPSDDYQAGKAAELGCGYGMGWEKFISAAWSVYQLRVSEVEAKAAVPVYRETHPRVVAFWSDTERACLEAVRKPGAAVTFGGRKNLKALVAGAYLYIILPSGRPLMYPAPHIADRMTPWKAVKPSLHFKGVDQYTHQWGVQSTYGGSLVENIVQAVSRDLMADAMLRLEAAGYPTILSVHDEIVCEVPKAFGTIQEFERLMTELPSWATGCPVAAEAWRGTRYRK